ncbi:Fic family protein [Actinorugispora endophytica]|uniref:Fic/DOC family protein n=1 Tax=Actinorugispora endophytica TaxID=1605990 RepID=A0A4R6V4Z7_9ACTN|nr:Fic family protein [Actinorugispora endophytica]TDQ53367.1 Fic/DOC family protein [Actinorugispora endophytica]
MLYATGPTRSRGYRAALEDAEPVVLGEEPLEAGTAVTREPAGHRMALSCIRTLGRAERFRYDLGLVHALDFMMIGHHVNKGGGVPRSCAVHIRNDATGETVYEGPDPDRVPALPDEFAAWINEGDPDAHACARAATAHLNLVKIHPWRDGNGRSSRAPHTLVLARGGVLSPYGETKGRFYAPGPLMTEIRADFERRREPLRDPCR